MLSERKAARLTGKPVLRLAARSGGETSEVYQAETADGRLVIKGYPRNLRWQQAKEAYVYSLLPAGLPVAEVVCAKDGYLVMTALEGTPLSEARDYDTRDVYRQLGSVLRRFHSVPQDGFGYITTRLVDPAGDNVTRMTERFETCLKDFAEYGGDPATGRRIERLIDPALFARCARPVLCHNDFHEGNILVKDGVVTGLIDMANVLAGDPLLDFAKADYYSMHGDATKIAGLIEGYGEMPGGWEEVLPLYRAFHALELWCWFASIGNTAPLNGIMADLRRA